MTSRHDKEYAPVKGTHEAPCGGRKKSAKTASHRLLRTHYKRELQKELKNVDQSVDNS